VNDLKSLSRGQSKTERRLGGDERGVALVEFVLVLPLLLVILFGMLDFGRVFNYWIDATHLANEGARFAVVNNNPDTSGTLQAYIQQQGDTWNGVGSGPTRDLHRLSERRHGRPARPRDSNRHVQLASVSFE
jgi:hypothetical protein